MGIPSKLLMSVSAVVMAIAGLALTFMPQEVLQWAGQAPTSAATLPVQVLGALYVGFALTNWMAKESGIGGIYGRPLLMGNLAHFATAAAALVRAAAHIGSPLLWAGAGVYVVFALLFGRLTFGGAKAPGQCA